MTDLTPGTFTAKAQVVKGNRVALPDETQESTDLLLAEELAARQAAIRQEIKALRAESKAIDRLLAATKARKKKQ